MRLFAMFVLAVLLHFVPSTWLVAVGAEVVYASHAEEVCAEQCVAGFHLSIPVGTTRLSQLTTV